MPDPLLLASLYAAVHTGSPGDVAFHVAQCAGAGRVLELGCGHGRIARALAEAGHDVVGIEHDPAPLALARRARLAKEVRARLDLREGDMRALALGARFDRVVIAHSTLYCLAGDVEVRATFAGVREHLAPRGRLLIDVWSADAFHTHADPDADDPEDEVARVRVRGRTFRVLERSEWDRPAQRVTAHYRYAPVRGGRSIRTSIVHRYLLAGQLEALLADEGLRTVRLAGAFDLRPHDEDAEQLVVIAERARRR